MGSSPGEYTSQESALRPLTLLIHVNAMLLLVQHETLSMKVLVLSLIMIVLSKFVRNDLSALSMNNLMSSVIQFGVCVQECAHILMVFLDVIFEGCYQAGTLEHDD